MTMQTAAPNRVIEKIKNLLALAGNNPSREEAAVAFERATDMATRHRIEIASLDLGDTDDDPMTHEVYAAGKRFAGWRNILLAGVTSSMGVFAVKGPENYTLAGKKSDVQAAQYMFAAISKEVERLAAANAAARGRKFANAYKIGVASAVSRRLRERHAATMAAARAATSTSETALARVADAEAQAQSYLAAMTGARFARTRRRDVETDAHTAGQKDAASIDLGGGGRAIGRGHLALGPAS